MSVEDRLARIERDVAYLKDVVEQMDRRLARLENELVHLRDEFSRRIDRLESRMMILILGAWMPLVITLMLKLLGVI